MFRGLGVQGLARIKTIKDPDATRSCGSGTAHRVRFQAFNP